MAREDDCMRERFVRVEFAGRRLGVPLAQLAPIGTGTDARQGIDDWRYWVSMGYAFRS